VYKQTLWTGFEFRENLLNKTRNFLEDFMQILFTFATVIVCFREMPQKTSARNAFGHLFVW
jgi:hypothetical protein